MTIGKRRMRNPDWHFRYHLTTLSMDQLRAAREQLSVVLPIDVFSEHSWIIDTEVAVERELMKRLLNATPI